MTGLHMAGLRMTGFWATYTHDMAHRHVLLAYGFAWLLQLGYLGIVLRRSRRSSSRELQ